MDHPTFGRWLKLRRGSLGLTQAQLGEQISYAGETIRKVEADELRPSRQMVEKLANALKIAPEERTAFLRFARDELLPEQVTLPTPFVAPPALPPPAQSPVVTASQPQAAPSLPLPRHPLIGREWEMTVIQTLLLRPSVGLVTLTGPGGVGKTRLALQIAANLRDLTDANAEPIFPAGVYFVSLAALDEPSLVLSAIAQALALRIADGTALLAALQEHLRQQQLLLVLDNFEQVVSAAPLLSDLLEAAPQLKILVTSRTVLRLRGEHHFVVPPLAVPDNTAIAPTSGALAADILLESAAVRFFVERAQAAQATFAVSSQNLTAISLICQQLEGLPLAIELAAARVRILPPQAMLARLGSQLKFLTGGPQDLPTRQQTMRSTLAWSYDLLNEGEKLLFRRLAFLVAGGTFEAIERICNADGALPMDTLEGLASLLDMSLLQQRSSTTGEVRFVALRVIREYALERLMESGEAEKIRRQQAAFYLACLEEAEPALVGKEPQIWLERIADDYDNLRALLEWATGEGDSDMGLRLAGALRRFWQIRGYYHEAQRWLPVLLAKTSAPTPARTKALDAAGFFAAEQGDYPLARLYHEEGLAIERQCNDPGGIAQALHSLAGIALNQGDYLAATSAFHESLDIRRALGDKPGMCASLNNLGIIAYEQGEYASARELLEEALLLKRAMGDRWGVSIALNNLGGLASAQGDYSAARQMHTESLMLRRELGNKKGIASSLNNLGELALHQDDHQTAQQLLTESLSIHQAIGDKAGAALVLNNLGSAAFQAGDFGLAQRYGREAIRILHEVGDKRIAQCLLGLARVAQVTQQLMLATRLLSAANTLLTTLGAQFETADHVKYELSERALRAELSAEPFALAWAEGQAWTFEQVVAQALAITVEL